MTSPSDELSRLSSPQVVRQVRQKMDQVQQPSTDQRKSNFDRQDIVDLSGQQNAAPQSQKTPVTPADINRYTQMLMKDVPDVRPDEVARVQDQIDQGGYGPDTVKKMMDNLMQDL